MLRQAYNILDLPTLQHYMHDFHTPFCGVMSHVNSGKTTAMVMKAHLVAANQHPDINGVRRTAHLFIRGTHGDLLRGVVRTFEKWIDPKKVKIRKSPPVNGVLRMQPMGDKDRTFPEFMVFNGKKHPYKLGGWNPDSEEYLPGAEDVSGVRIGDVFPNGTFVDALFDFVPLDNPDWESTLLGTEYTAAYFDEPDSMSNIEEVLTKLPGRLGRYPQALNAPMTCTQVNMAFNPPRRGSFTQEFFHTKNEHLGRKLYRVQPPFLMIPDKDEPDNFYKAEFIRNPDAEGVRLASKGWSHWEELINANRHDANKIRRDVLGEFTKGAGGKSVHPDFNSDHHLIKEEIPPSRKNVLLVSMDWGCSGACLIGQYMDGGMKIIEEISGENVPSHIFVKDVVIPHLNSEYRGFQIVITGDPSGRYARDTGDGPFELFRDKGFIVEDQMANDPEARWAAVDNFLRLRDAMLISEPNCPTLCEGFEGEYVFKTAPNGTVIKQVDKRKHHTAYMDCLQAMCQLIEGGYETAASSALGAQNTDIYEEEDDFVWV